MNKKFLRTQIRQILKEFVFGEERISNADAKEKVKARENFVGSHTYGEDLGDLGKMYVVYSYEEGFPLFVWADEKWYYNTDDYILPGGKVNIWTRKHKKQLFPTQDAEARPKSWLTKRIASFKKKNNLGKNSHKDVLPGEK